jgi:CheY-like chemotaxis protein
VEDDGASAQLIESQLTSGGYGTHRCNDSRRVLDLAADLQPLAITLDILMKPINGWQVLAMLKRDPRTRSIPVILVTVVDQRPIGSMLGADDYLLKPVEKEALLKSVERCLMRRTVQTTPRILVADDDPAVVETISAMLEGRNYLVTVAADGAEARAAMRQEKPSVVILDLIMPRVGGFDLLAEWRADPATAGVPIVVLTSKDLTREEEDQLRGQTQGLFQKWESWREPLMKALERSLEGHS